MALAMIFTLTLCATFLTREINAIPPKPCPDCICAIEAKMEDITANALFPAGFPKHFRKPPTDCSSSNPNCKCVEVDPVTECEVQSGKAVAKPGEKCVSEGLVCFLSLNIPACYISQDAPVPDGCECKIYPPQKISCKVAMSKCQLSNPY